MTASRSIGGGRNVYEPVRDSWFKRNKKAGQWMMYVLAVAVFFTWSYRLDHNAHNKKEKRQDRQAEQLSDQQEQIKKLIVEQATQIDKTAMDTYDRCVNSNEVRSSIRGLVSDILDQTNADAEARVEIMALAQARLAPSDCEPLKPNSTTTTTAPKEGN